MSNRHVCMASQKTNGAAMCSSFSGGMISVRTMWQQCQAIQYPRHGDFHFKLLQWCRVPLAIWTMGWCVYTVLHRYSHSNTAMTVHWNCAQIGSSGSTVAAYSGGTVWWRKTGERGAYTVLLPGSWMAYTIRHVCCKTCIHTMPICTRTGNSMHMHTLSYSYTMLTHMHAWIHTKHI